MSELPKRKQNRLKDFDYSSDGCYFITICTNDRKCILSKVIVGADTIRPNTLELTDCGKIVDEAIKTINTVYNNVSAENYVIMPNHIHLLLKIEKTNGRMVSAPTVIAGLKRYVSKNAGFPVWQKGFYDHIIRDEYDYMIHYQYIDENPLKWVDDKYYIK